jgi:hypothetical protein
VKEGHSRKERFLMDAPMEAKKPPEVKTWVRRVVEAASAFRPANEEKDDC